MSQLQGLRAQCDGLEQQLGVERRVRSHLNDLQVRGREAACAEAEAQSCAGLACTPMQMLLLQFAPRIPACAWHAQPHAQLPGG